MVEDEVFERAIKVFGSGIANIVRKEEPNFTEAEIDESARNFMEFIRILSAMDAEQKAKMEK